MGIGGPREHGVSGMGIEGGHASVPSQEEARARYLEVSRMQARQSGRLEIALRVKSLLSGRALSQEMPGAEPLTEAERAVWDLVYGFSERMGATVEEVEKGYK